jgi:hypothetical protein
MKPSTVKKISGQTRPFSEQTVTLILPDGSRREFARQKIARIRRTIVFE